MRRPILLLIAILLLTSLSCKTLIPGDTPPTPVLQEATVEVFPTQDTTSAPTKPAATADSNDTGSTATQPAPDPTAVLEPDVARSMDQIQEAVKEIRGLYAWEDVPRALLTPDELRQRVIDDFLADYAPEDAQQDVIELSALGLIEPGYDFLDFYTELLSEQVAGFYDNEVKEMYVVQGESFAAPERLTFAHEYVHALQDQNYDIENGLQYNDESCEEDTERCAAIQALLEGDASTVELQWFINYATQKDQQEVLEFYDTYSSPIYDSAPDFMKEDFIFPYTYGQAFVEKLLDDGGWEAVNAAYANLPVSTEQILHPEKYPDDTPVSVELPDLLPTLGDGWEELDRNVMGEWYTYLILAKGSDLGFQLEAETAEDAAAGWGGDAYVIYHHQSSGQTALVVDWLWDRDRDADQFAKAFREYADARFGLNGDEQRDWWVWEVSEATSLLYANDDRTTWIYAPDLATAQAIADAMGIER